MDISMFRERTNTGAFTVSELNNYIKTLLDSNRTLTAVSIVGEISNLTDHRSGHLYFSLKDSEGQIRAVMFRSARSKLKFVPEDGMKVTVRGTVSLYPQTGSVQLYVNTMTPDGVGDLYKAYEQLKKRLAEEGLFDDTYKKSLPRFPQKIGVITSPTGAAVRDIINVTGRRYPLAQLYLYPSLVQGEGAESNLIEAIEYFESSALVDVLIIGRGGGSIEDLWAFNGERLARKIFACDIPIISAVGHETDFTIADFVADLRAPTPSAAAEIAVPDIRDLCLFVDSAESRLPALLSRTVERKKERLESLTAHRLLKKPEELFVSSHQRLEDLYLDLKQTMTDTLEKNSQRLGILSGKTDALSPLSVLARGYSIVVGDDGLLKSAKTLNVGEDVKITFTDGCVEAKIQNVLKKSKKGEKV